MGNLVHSYGFQNFGTIFPSSIVSYCEMINKSGRNLKMKKKSTKSNFLIIVFGDHMQYFWNLPPFFLEFNTSFLEYIEVEQTRKLISNVIL